MPRLVNMDSMSYPQASSLEVPLNFLYVLLILLAKQCRLAGQSLTLAIAYVQMLEHELIGANIILRIFTDSLSVSQCLGCLQIRLNESYEKVSFWLYPKGASLCTLRHEVHAKRSALTFVDY